MDQVKRNGPVIRFFITLALSLGFGLVFSRPGWEIYVQIKDLGAGGVGSKAQPDTPAAHSIVEMEELDRFVIHSVQTKWDNSEGFHLLDNYYKVVTLDSGERVAMRYNLDTYRYDPSTDLWSSPIGVWRPWKLTAQERAIVAREAPDLSDTNHYADMLGAHQSALSRGVFAGSFVIWGTLSAMAVLTAAQIWWHFHQKKRSEITKPKSDLELWLVGTYAIWGQFYAGLYGSGMDAARKGPFHIGSVPRTRETVREMKETLDDCWDIGSYEELLDTVEYMSVGPGFERCLSQADRAWELCRSMQLLGCAYLVGWCSREEMLRRSCEVGRLIQQAFWSWDDLCQNFLDGFTAWRLSGAVDEKDMASVQQRVDVYWAIKGRKDSPYRLPWRMELDPGKSAENERQ